MHLLVLYFEVLLLIVFLHKFYWCDINYVTWIMIYVTWSIIDNSEEPCLPGVLILSSMKYNAWNVFSQSDFCGDGKLSVNWKNHQEITVQDGTKMLCLAPSLHWQLNMSMLKLNVKRAPVMSVLFLFGNIKMIYVDKW